jgi:type I restriction enzyme S subunit
MENAIIKILLKKKLKKSKKKLIARKIVKKDLTYSKLDRKYQIPQIGYI